MTTKWNQGSADLAIRLGQLAIRAQGLLLAQKIQGIQQLAQAHTRDLLRMPGGKRKLAEAQKHIDAVKQLLKDNACG